MTVRASAKRRRRGVLAVEGSIVYSVLFLLLLGLIVGGIGVFRYQQTACLAREGARWASLHGGDWQTENNQQTTTQEQILQKGVLPFAAGMDPASVSIQVDYVNRAASQVSEWDQVSHPPTGRDVANNLVTNRVRVTVTYQWMPGALLVGPLYLTSTSEVTMWY
jgi:Flp pilus assembly protein TadG